MEKSKERNYLSATGGCSSARILNLHRVAGGMALTLYSWPHLWNLPTFDADCLAVILYLQLVFPANYSIVECTDPDISPSGTLPFLVHNSTNISGVSSIFAYLSSLVRKSDEWAHGTTTLPNLDEALNHEQKAESVAWKAYINTHISNLVVCGSSFVEIKKLKPRRTIRSSSWNITSRM